MEVILVKGPSGQVDVFVVRKKIKNVHLKVYRDLSVAISVPNDTPFVWIEEYVNAHSVWIFNQLDKYKRGSGYNNLSYLKSGSSTQMLGKDLRVYILKDSMDFIEKTEKGVIMHLEDPADRKHENEIFERWWRQYALNIFSDIVDGFMPIFERHEVQKPSFTIRKMKTLWGSCSKKLGKITLNEYLLKADIRCIEYVVLHEMTHLLYNGHNKDFYNFMTIYMPDWKERKRQLDMEVAQGL